MKREKETSSRELQILWWDWLSTAERLLRTLKEQTNALTIRDVARLEALQPELDRYLSHLKRVDEEAVVSARVLAENLGVEPGFRNIVEALANAEAQQIVTLATRVSAVAKNVQSSLAKNRKLIESELHYVDGSLSLIARLAQEKQGQFASSSNTPALLNQVA